MIPIVPTPFKENGELDTDSLRRLVDYLLGAGVHGLAVLGVASEVYSLRDSERLEIVSVAARQVNGRVPLLAGSSHHSGEAAATLARQAEALGVDGLLVMPPHFVKPTNDALMRYFELIDAAVQVPIMVQDNPAWTGVNLPVELLLRLSEFAHVRYVKVETVHPPTRVRELFNRAADLVLFGGAAGNWLPEELAGGSRGTMPAAIMPQVFVGVVELWEQGDHDQARALFHHYHPLIRVTAQQSVGFAMVKWLLWSLDLISTPTVRNPLSQLGHADRADLEQVCADLEVFGVMQGAVR